jgi:hypothetical protein
MGAYCAEVRKLEKHFQGLEILHVLCDSNIAADVLAKFRLDRAKVPPSVFIEKLSAPSIKQPDEITPELLAPSTQILVITLTWTQAFVDYIKENKLPANKEEATRVVRRSKNYVLVGGQTLQMSHLIRSTSQMRLIRKDKEILGEIHSGCCGNHVASKRLVGKAFHSRFYWLISLKDAEELVRKCKGCQIFARQTHIPTHNLICILPAWPFSCWGLDQVGPLKKAKDGFEYIFVAIDKFTKWIKYKPLIKYSAAKAVKFIQDIMHCFSMPN